MPIVIDTNTIFPITIRDVTQQWDGLMTAADKIKLDGLTPGGGGTLLQAYQAATVPADNVLLYTAALGGVFVQDAAGLGTVDGYFGVLYGAGAQELFVVRDSGIVSNWDSFGTQTNLGIFTLANVTAAALGAQQYSPDIRLRARGYATGPAASRTVDFHMQAEAAQGVANPTGSWSLRSRINGGANNLVFQVDSAGRAYTFGGLTVFGDAVDVNYINSDVPDGALAVATKINTNANYTTNGAQLLALSSAGATYAAFVRENGVWAWDVTLMGSADMKAAHYLSYAAAKPTLAINLGGWVVGTNGAWTVVDGSTDERGTIQLVGGTGLTGVNWFGADADVVTITLNRAFPNGFEVLIGPGNNATAVLMNQFGINQSFSAYATALDTWVIHTATISQGLIDGTTYKFTYRIRGY